MNIVFHKVKVIYGSPFWKQKGQYCFNCWNGSCVIPISSQFGSARAANRFNDYSARRYTISMVEMGSTQTGNAVGEDIV